MDDRVRGLTLVLPACNEAAGIREAIAEADAALAALADDYEIIVVDDGSRDGTAALVGEAAVTRPHVRLLRHNHNRGYGAALRTGFQAARFDLVAFTDADCQFHLEDLGHLLRLVQHHPIAVGYRVGRQDPWPRRFFSWGYNHVVRHLLGTRVRDCDCALKVFRRHALQKLLPESHGFFVNTEMLTRARQQGLDVAEAGVRHRPRLRGRSTVSLGQIPRILSVLLPFWWSRVLFAGAYQQPTSRPQRSWFCPALVLVVAGLLFFSGLDAPLLEPQEARYAEIPRQMLQQDGVAAWQSPVLHGQPYLDKPPLLYWSVMLSYQLFGVHDWAARLVPGLASVLTVMVVFLWGRRTIGERGALAGALILCLSARFVYLGRMLAFDVLLTLFVTSALATAHCAITAKPARLRRGWWLLSAAACGLGILTKGPVALLLVLPPIMVLMLLDQRFARGHWCDWGLYLLTCIGVATPWFVVTAAQNPGYLEYFLLRHNLQRFVAPFDHSEPFWFYLPGVILGTFPWCLLLPGLFQFLGRKSRRVAARRPMALGFFLLAAIWGLLFFSFSGSKRAVYILPVFPPFALALGCYLDATLPRWLAARRPAWASFLQPLRTVRLARAATLLVLVVGAGLALAGVTAGLIATAHGVLLACIALALVGPIAVSRLRTSWVQCAGATFALLFVGVQVAQPAYNHRFGLRALVLRSAEEGNDPTAPVMCYPKSWDSVSFYLKSQDVRIFSLDQKQQLIAELSRHPRTLLFVKDGDVADDLVRSLPKNLHFTPQRRHGTVLAGWVRSRSHANPSTER